MKKSVGYLLIVVLLLSVWRTKAKKIEFDGERTLGYIKEMEDDAMFSPGT